MIELTEYGKQHFETPFTDGSLEVIHLPDGRLEVAVYPKRLEQFQRMGLCMAYNGSWEVDEDGDWCEEGDLVSTSPNGYGGILVRLDYQGRVTDWEVEKGCDRPSIMWDRDYYRDEYGKDWTESRLEERAMEFFDVAIKGILSSIELDQSFVFANELAKVA